MSLAVMKKRIMVFTGLVQARGFAHFGVDFNSLTVRASEFWTSCKIGDSIAINGCCLTITGIQEDQATFMIMEETLSKTIFRSQKVYSSSIVVNLEKALKYGENLGGHFISGHIDGIYRIKERINHDDGSCSLWISLGSQGGKYVVEKCSIAINGVSLTVAEIKRGYLTKDESLSNDCLIRVSLIPHTLENTTLMHNDEGDMLNIEFDQQLKHMQATEEVHVVESVQTKHRMEIVYKAPAFVPVDSSTVQSHYKILRVWTVGDNVHCEYESP
jgi:riboflavin synthase